MYEIGGLEVVGGVFGNGKEGKEGGMKELVDEGGSGLEGEKMGIKDGGCNGVVGLWELGEDLEKIGRGGVKGM